jgi:hypothetical protein
VGYYDSLDDQSGTLNTVRNSEARFLAGFEREVGRDLTGSIQYYLEYMQDYTGYEENLTPGSRKNDAYRHLFTVRFTKLLMNQSLRLSLFAYLSPSDEDVYFRPKAHYKLTDHWALEAGANIFSGSDDHTFFGQFDHNTNIYASVRFSF